MMYWKEKQNQLVLDINNSSGSTRDRLVSELYPALNTMAQAILKRYFVGAFNEWEIENLTTDAISRLLIQLNKFDPERAKAFSFCQTVIKNHYHTTLITPPLREQAWRETVNEDTSDIDVDQQMQYSYEDKNLDIELSTISERMLGRLYSIKKDVDESYEILLGQSQYERRIMKSRTTETPKYPHCITKLRTVINTMIDILEENPVIDYEAFIIELYKKSKVGVYSLVTTTEQFGMNFPNMKFIIDGASGALDYKNEQRDRNHFKGVLEVLEEKNDDDCPNTDKVLKRFRVMSKKKRDSK